MQQREGVKFAQGAILQHLADGLGGQQRPVREFRTLAVFLHLMGKACQMSYPPSAISKIVERRVDVNEEIGL